MFEEFNKIYNLKPGTPFKFIELWKGLLDKFRDVGFSSFPMVELEDGQILPAGYTCGFKFEWESYLYAIDDSQPTCYEALCQLFLKYHDYTDWDENIGQDLHDIVDKIYKGEKVCNSQISK